MTRYLMVVAALLFAGSLSAHDFWIEPSTFRPAVGEEMFAGLRVGQNFEGDAVPRSGQLMQSFVIRDAAGERAIGGFENQDPAGYLRIEKPGRAILAYQGKPQPLVLDAAKFEESLRLEGLERIILLRKQRGESGKGDRERFSRYAKAIVVAPGGSGVRVDRPLGLRYEIVPDSDPAASTPLRVRLLFEGKPLAGALVSAIHRDDVSARVSVRSDAGGRATLALPKAGVWLIKSVQMVPAPDGADFDWESLWASLTFER
jgi:uncharacterized GH25 family protein